MKPINNSTLNNGLKKAEKQPSKKLFLKKKTLRAVLKGKESIKIKEDRKKTEAGLFKTLEKPMAPLSAKETSKSSLCLSFSFGFRYRKQETNMFFFWSCMEKIKEHFKCFFFFLNDEGDREERDCDIQLC